MTINDPVVIAELTALHEVYERALIDNDVPTLESLFWDSPHAIRYGVTENLHGAAEIQAFRLARPKMNLDRVVSRREIMSFGTSSGIINLEFVRAMDGVERHGRQTQFWTKLPDPDRGELAWRIVSAHVSLLPAPTSYMDAAAARIGLPIPAASRREVEDDLSRITTIAGFLMEFPLDQSIEAAPVFQS